MEKINWFEKSSLIPTLPKVALDLIETFKQDEPDTKRLERDIEADSVLCARVLRLANSPYYAVGRSIKTISEALMILGFSPVRNIALSTAVSSLGKSSNGMELGLFSSLTLLTAMSSESLGSYSGMEKGQAFAAGLLRPIGLLLMRSVKPAEMSQLDTVKPMLDARRADEERRIFGVDHAELSGELSKRWKLPDGLVDALAGSGVAYASVSLAQWAASRSLSPAESLGDFDAYAKAMEWAHQLNLSCEPQGFAWPSKDDVGKRFGALAG